MDTPQRYIQLDEEGYFKQEDLRVADPEYGRHLFEKLTIDPRGRYVTEYEGMTLLVEPFDEPYVAQRLEMDEAGVWTAQMPYGHREPFRPQTLSVDEWDRFHGRTERGVPFVLSRAAQAAFFDDLDDFDDESIVIAGQRLVLPDWLTPNPDINTERFWSNVYQTEEPRWELNKPTPVLARILPRLKLAPQRVLVLGAGSGNDAAYFAEQGHFVTAVDFSPEALSRAQAKYGAVRNLKFVAADVFALPPSFDGAFDLIFEHTCFCAVSPERRNELVRVWRRALTDQGTMLGVFFAMDRRQGPPYGGSEWELRARLQKTFRFLYWMRFHDSIEGRQGTEFLVYAQKLSALR